MSPLVLFPLFESKFHIVVLQWREKPQNAKCPEDRSSKDPVTYNYQARKVTIESACREKLLS